MKLSVVILNYNVKHFLQLCLQSVEAAITDIDAEIIVVDNNSPDESVQMVKDLFPSVKLIVNKENLGFSKGNNLGVNEASGEYICVLNPDTVVAEDTFKKILSFANQVENIGIIGCKLINGRGQFLLESKRNLPTISVAFRKLLGQPKRYYANHISENEVARASILVGAFMLMKRSVFEAVTGFDEDYFMYGEDIDLSYRIEKAGFENYYFGDTTIIHFKGESTLKDKRYSKHFFNAMNIFYHKHFEKNIFYDLFVWIGLKSAYLMESKSKPKISRAKMHLLVGDQHKGLEKIFGGELETSIEPTNVYPGTELILDASKLSFSKIVSIIGKETLSSQATFKIIPKDSKFLIGSNNAETRGEVIKF